LPYPGKTKNNCPNPSYGIDVKMSETVRVKVLPMHFEIAYKNRGPHTMMLELA
jgi:hypothetical protein